MPHVDVIVRYERSYMGYTIGLTEGGYYRASNGSRVIIKSTLPQIYASIRKQQ